MYRIGITEAGDAGLDLSWEEKLDSVDGAIVITKHVNKQFIDAVLRNADKLIVHATVTGYGGTVVEPNVPLMILQYRNTVRLINSGFPQERVVIRIDPIIPTDKGIDRAERVLHLFSSGGFHRFRISVIDMYPHVRKRFAEAGLYDPYNGQFQASPEQFSKVDYMLREIQSRIGETCRIESCAEPNLNVPIQCGCISEYDLHILGLQDENQDFSGYQRKNCMCYAGKTELLNKKKRCKHQCLYCYWKS